MLFRTLALLALLPALPAYAQHSMQMNMDYVPSHGSLESRYGPAVTALADTVTVSGLTFDSDGDPKTQVDSTFIEPGGTITWNWVSGSHTITSGTGSADPQAGALFNAPSNTSVRVFSVTFPNPGVYPYFCVFHEGFDMKGYIVVRSLVGVPETPRAAAFLGDPVPNPTRGEVRFSLRLTQAGPVRAEIYDAAGRLVATLVNETRAAGEQSILWKGSARPGTYFLRVRAPGFDGKQAVVLVR